MWGGERGEGAGSFIVGSKLNKFEYDQTSEVMLGPCTRTPLLDRQTDRQTDMTEKHYLCHSVDEH